MVGGAGPDVSAWRRDWRRRQRQGDFFDVLGGGGEQALASDGEQSAEAGVAVAVELFGVGEGALDGFLAASVDALAPRREAMGVGALAGVALGALVGEIALHGRSARDAVRPALGAAVGRVIGSLAKLPCALVAWIVLVYDAFT